MRKSGLIIGVVSLLFSFGAAFVISPLCVPCLAFAFGLLAGYFAGLFDKPGDQNRAVRVGALAGLIGGVGLLLGQVIGAVVNSIVIGPEGVTRMLAQMGYFVGSPAQIEEVYWIGIALSTACLVVFDAALMAGFGALGGLLWWKSSGEKLGSSIDRSAPLA